MSQFQGGSRGSSKVLPANAPLIHQRLLQKWLLICEDRAPTLRDFDFDASLRLSHEPFQIERVDTDGGGTAFHFGRLSPTAQKMYQRDFTGSNMRVVMSATEYDRTAHIYQASLEAFAPHYWEKVRSFYGREPVHFLRLALPLVDDQDVAKWLFGSLVWFKDRANPIPPGVEI